MRHLTLCCCFALLLASCKKTNTTLTNKITYPQLRQSLSDSLPSNLFQNLDFSRVLHSSYGSTNLLRIAFRNKSIVSSFVLVEADEVGHIRRGRIVELTRDTAVWSFNGTLTTKSLSGNLIEHSGILNGYRIASPSTRIDIVPGADDALPEVIVVGRYPSFASSISPGAWYNLLSFMDDGVSGNPIYASSGGGSAGDASTASNSTNAGAYPNVGTTVNASGELVIEADYEELYSKPPIDLETYLRCFDALPDAGATCTLTIFSDIPVNSDPSLIMDWNSGFPGHCWIQLQKKNNSQQISQQIGFYPASSWKTVTTTAPLAAKFSDDGQHEFNASFSINISASKLQSALTRIRQLARSRYDIDDYNCTDWALEIWKAAADPDRWLEVPRFQMPGSLSPSGTNTPQGLYEKIKDLQISGTPGALIPNIGWSGNSTGPCN